MKYKVKDYANSLVEILSDKSSKLDDKKIIEGFLKMLKREQDLSKAREIIEQTEFLLAKQQGNKSVTFETARKMTEEQKKSFKSFLEKGDIVKEKINLELIAGIKVTVDGNKQLDQTMLKKINSLFKK